MQQLGIVRIVGLQGDKIPILLFNKVILYVFGITVLHLLFLEELVLLLRLLKFDKEL
jgi:hypothetical protein